MSLEAQERSKYERMWDRKGYRKSSPGERAGDHIIAHLRAVGAQSVLDAGCGSGRLTGRLVDEGFDVQALDIAHNCMDEAQREKLGDRFRVGCLWDDHDYVVDAVICTDVLEHIPEEKVPAVMRNLCAWGDHGFLNIAMFHDSFGQQIGETLHLTVKPKEWWMPLLPEGCETTGNAKNLVVWW